MAKEIQKPAFGPGPGRRGAPPIPGAKFDGKSFRRVLGYVMHFKFKFIFVVIGIIINSVSGVVGSMSLQVLIDDYITPLLGQENPDYSGLLGMVLVLSGVFAVAVLTTLMYTRIMVDISQSVMKKIRDDMFAHMQTLPIKYFDTNQFGDIMSRYTNDIDTLRQLISQSIPSIIASVISIVSMVAGMIAMNVWLTLFTFGFVFLIMIATALISGKSGKYFVKQQKDLGAVNGYIEEMINGQKVIKVFCREDRTKEEFDELNEALCDSATKANGFINILGPITNNLGHLQYVALAFLGGVMMLSNFGGVTVGSIATFLQLSKSFTMSINQVAQQMNMIVAALAGAGRIFALMDEKSETDDGYVTLVNAKYVDGVLTEVPEHTGIWAWKHPHSADGTITYTEVKGDVTLDDVDFGYTEEKMVLHNVSVFAKPGQKIAFVGSTGAGKTTITNLINRFYDIADGKIRYDGININKIKKSDLRRSLGIVLQDVNLFTGTVMENIRYGNLDATDEEVYAAARLANADGFIRRLPDGYNTMLTGDGGSLSQGQRQLISIARAAVADPPVMILDEATSSIDTRTEILVQKGMDSLMHGRTVFVIAHRLSTIKNSNVIMVLDLGRIIERGTHEDLLAEKGRYYELYTGKTEMK